MVGARQRAGMRLVLGLALGAAALAGLVTLALLVARTGWDDGWLRFLPLPVAFALVLQTGVSLTMAWWRDGAAPLPRAAVVGVGLFVMTLGVQMALLGAFWAAAGCLLAGVAVLLWRPRPG